MVPRAKGTSERFFTIGEVAEMTGVKPSVLRYWEQEFKQLRPLRRRKGAHRLYGPKDVEIVRCIQHLLREEGLSIVGARKRLQEPRQEDLPFHSVSSSAREVFQEVRQGLADLEALLSDDDQEDESAAR